ncbi:hypothetical protein WAJ76_22450, partial [Acinetobacter baumannii]
GQQVKGAESAASFAHLFLQAAVKGGVALAFRKQQRKFILSEMGFILWAVQRRVLSTAVHPYPILVQHMMAYRLAAVQ